MTNQDVAIPPESLWIRMLVVSTFLLWAVWAPTLTWLAGGAFMAHGCRWIFRSPWQGWWRELGYAVVGGGAVALLAASHVRLDALPAFIATTALRFHLTLSPGLWFSSTLQPREIAYAGRRFPPCIALSLEMALRFIPLLGREFSDIYTLQKARGAWSHGPLKWRLQALLLPFFVRLFRLGDRAAFALTSRGIDPNARRCTVPPEIVRKLLAAKSSEAGEAPCHE